MALFNAQGLLHAEIESIVVSDLKEEYLQVLSQIQNPLLELDRSKPFMHDAD